MHRIPRDPEKFGPLELADCIGVARNIDLAEVSETISFSDLLGASRSNDRLIHGKRVENMFEYVVASLGKALIIKREDAGDITCLNASVQPPDYRVVFRDGSEYLIEVKNCHNKSFDQPFSMSKKYLDRLRAYAELFRKPLLLAIYWSNLRMWTVVRPEEILTRRGAIQLKFADAMMHNWSALLGDLMLSTIPPLTCRIWADRNKPRALQPDSTVRFVISAITFYAAGNEILSEEEKIWAWYFMLHSRWTETKAEPVLNDGQLEYIEYESAPRDDTPEHDFQHLGTLSGMVSSYYNYLTVSEDGRVTRLTPSVGPAALSIGLRRGFYGDVLKLWMFEVWPRSKPERDLIEA
ncbi:hypothetical protein HHL24_30910 [Paraburkholderia sp. RP-4-7]|uniref:Restriction endonuclease n=1 Tax=Paraburkholderia polaris TaxID=2728848 RepID=A0A848IJ54_9BURK|nr:hypothetical protein [Paraburkholderia polaris]NMM02322.1 hypothetical protein [Paraburkholderia polaris]